MWDLRVGKRKRDQSAENAGVTNPVLIIPAAQGGDGIGARLKGRKGKSPSQVKSVTSLAYLDGEPYRLISSGSFDGYVAKLVNLLRFRDD
jgi:denticleless